MSLINALSIAHYINIKNNAAYSIARVNSARMNMISSLDGSSSGSSSLASLCAIDTQMELDLISNKLQYRIAQAMLDQLKKQQKRMQKSLIHLHKLFTKILLEYA